MGSETAPDAPTQRRASIRAPASLLRTLIAQHIRDGEPVGSRTLARAARAWTSVRPPSATSCPTSRRSACSRRRIPRPGAFRPRRATACSSTRCCRCKPLPEAEVDDLRSRHAGRRRHPGPAVQRLRAAVGDEPVRRRGDRAAARPQFAFRHDRFRAAGRAARAGDPGVHRQRSAEPHHQPAPRLQPRPSWSRPPTTSTRISPAGRCTRSAPRCCASCARRAREMERVLSAAVELSEQALQAEPRRRHAAGRPDPADGPAGPVRPGPAARAVRGLFAQARDPAAARTLQPRARACASSSARKPAWRRWTAAPWSPRPTAPTARCWACWA